MTFYDIGTYKDNLGNTLKITQDYDAESPTKYSELFSTFTWHREYSYTDGEDYGDIEDMIIGYTNLSENSPYHPDTEDEYKGTPLKLLNKDYIYKPVYMYDHSDIAYSTTPFTCKWDSGMVGVIIASKKDIRKHYNVKRISKKLREEIYNYMHNIISEFSDWDSGNVYSVEYIGSDGVVDDDKTISNIIGFDYLQDYINNIREDGHKEWIGPLITTG